MPFLAPPAERQRSFSNADSSVVRRPSSSTFHFKSLFLRNCLITFLAPPAERQRSFSNADSSVVRRRLSSSSSSSVVNFSVKSLISQKLADNFCSFLACSFLRMVPMYSKNMDLVESS